MNAAPGSTEATHRLHVGGVSGASLSQPVGDPALQQARRLAPRARSLVLVAHANAASQNDAGHKFVVDVLHANGFATVCFCLHDAADQAAGRAAPGMVQSKQRVGAIFDALAADPMLDRLPVALLGLGNAVQGCVAAAARLKLRGLRALVLLDGRADQVPHHLCRLTLPTLFVLGHADARRLSKHRVAMRSLPGGHHRTEVLQHPVRPAPARGALEAFACKAVAWFDDSLVHDTRDADCGWRSSGGVARRATPL